MIDTRLSELLEGQQFTFTAQDRNEKLLPVMESLTAHHKKNCDLYGRILDGGGLPAPSGEGLEQLQFIPVRTFKELDIASVSRNEIVKVLTSSGTTGQSVSRINLDSANATLQQKSLSSVMRTVLGNERLPMLIVDSKSIIKNRNTFSARAAGVLGMMTFGRSHTWLLNEEMELDKAALKLFLNSYGDKPFLIFGFTFMVWQYLLSEIGPQEFDLSNGILVHSGGWKKLQDEAVSTEVFNNFWKTKTGLTNTKNFYGMVEQIGSIFVEGEDGWLYCPNFADVIIRNPADWSVCAPGEPGIIEVISALPSSYPGHVLLTEDIGISAEQELTGPWLGTKFKVLGRLPRAELRGCSDTHASENR